MTDPRPQTTQLEAPVLLLSPKQIRIRRDGEQLLFQPQPEAPPFRPRFRLLFPLSCATGYISVLNGEEEVGILEDLDAVPAALRELILEELKRSYFLPRIEAVRSLTRKRRGIYQWTVQTDRGDQTFDIELRANPVKLLSDNRILITDVTGCRYEIMSLATLPRASRRLLELML